MAGCGPSRIDFEKMGGVVPVVMVDFIRGYVLTQAFANVEAVEATLRSGYAHFYSRSRGRLWMKGERSGNRMRVVEVVADCDCDSLLYLVEPEGPACHTGEYTCFHNPVEYGRRVYSRLAEDLWREIVDAFRSARIVVKRGYGGLEEYIYIVNPVTDNIPPPSPRLVALLSEAMKRFLESSGRADKVVVPEALGLPIGSVVAQKLGLPMAVVRKRRYPVDGVSVKYTSGYEEGVYHVYGVERGERVYLIDDAVSTGGTLRAVVSALREEDVEVVAVAASIFKPQYGALEAAKSIEAPFWRAVDVYVSRNGGVILVNPSTGERVELRVPVVEG